MPAHFQLRLPVDADFQTSLLILPMATCSACSSPVTDQAGEQAICCGAIVCPSCWELDRTCASPDACTARQEANRRAQATAAQRVIQEPSN